VIRFSIVGASAATLPTVPAIVEGPIVEYQTDEPTVLLHTLTGWAMDNGTSLHGLTVTRPSLEDIYLELTNGELS
jgi:ABC-2 type transport system ATP-binding protein